MAEYNVIVIGAGPGGYVCAIKCAQLGLSVALVEERDVGGTCLNRGCIPTKALLHSAEIYDSLKDAEKYGILVQNPAFDFAGIQAKKADVVAKLRGGVEALVAANKIALLRGKGVILESGKVQVGDEVHTCEKIVIATGSVPAVPPIPGLDLEGVITSDGLLEHTDSFDESMVIIGGGVIGVEFASVYASLGCQVTIIEALPRLLARMDKDISANLQMILKKKGVKVCVDSKVLKVEKNAEGGLDVHYECKGKEALASGKKVLVAIGRRPNTAGLFGEGVEIASERGRILVSEQFETSLAGVYAIGDVSTTLQLAHVASAQGIYVAELLAGHKPEGDLSLVPSCIYTSPEIASIGLTEEEATAQGYAVKASKVMMHSNGKTLIAGGERGFMKVVTEEGTGKLLGAQLMCERATDMLSEFTTAMVGGLDAHTMGKVMRPHPTFNEGVSELFEMANEGMSIHTAPARKR